MMKNIIYLLICFLFIQCNTTKNTTTDQPVSIANEDLEYEIIIFDNGFQTYLNSIAKPMNFYSENYYEQRNRNYVIIWNQRVNNLNFDKNIYENIIDYDFNTHYGIEVNYKLFNYFKFVEYKYNQTF